MTFDQARQSRHFTCNLFLLLWLLNAPLALCLTFTYLPTGVRHVPQRHVPEKWRCTVANRFSCKSRSPQFKFYLCHEFIRWPYGEILACSPSALLQYGNYNSDLFYKLWWGWQHKVMCAWNTWKLYINAKYEFDFAGLLLRICMWITM